jgi:hypothetical protein
MKKERPTFNNTRRIFLISILMLGMVGWCFGEDNSVSKFTENYVYVKTRKAVIENERGQVILQLYAPNKITVIDSGSKKRLQVTKDGWINKNEVEKIGGVSYRANRAVMSTWFWSEPEFVHNHDYYKSIGQITDHTLMAFLGESHTTEEPDFVIYRNRKDAQPGYIYKNGKFLGYGLFTEQKDSTVYIKVRISGWIESKYVTSYYDDTQQTGEIFGRLIKNGKPATNIRVSLDAEGVDEQLTDIKGFYRFSDLKPNIEYKINMKLGDKSYSNIESFPILDPGEKLRVSDIDIAKINKISFF